MSNDLTQSGSGNIALQDVRNSTINITQLLGNSYQYNDLLDRLNIQRKLFIRTPEDETQERLEISAKINELTDQIEQFKQDILKLAEAFQNIEINTDRLKRAKEFFDRGEIGEARAVLETEIEQMQNEQKRLLKEREHYESETLPKLQNNSEEFYLLALSVQADYDNPNRFEDVCRYFQNSIESYATKFNVFHYAKFLQDHCEFNNAEFYYVFYLKNFKSDIDLYEHAMILNNLAILHRHQNKYIQATIEYEKALHIYRKLSKDNPNKHLLDVAIALNNFGDFLSLQNNYSQARNKLEESLEIYNQISAGNHNFYLLNIGMVLNNLGIVYTMQLEYIKAIKVYEEALQIRRKLAAENPSVYLCYVAKTLNNLAGLNVYQEKYTQAQKQIEEALKIYRELIKVNSNAYLPDLAWTLNNLAAFYQKGIYKKDKSLDFAIEAVVLLLKIVEKVPYTQRYLETTMTILSDWGLNTDEINKLVKEKSGKIAN